MNYNELAAQVYEQNKAAGWWANPDRDINETLMLVVTEIAEATEGVRKDLMDDHLPHRKMEEVELADTLIRLLDLAGRYSWRYESHLLPPRLFDEYARAEKPMGPAAEHFALVTAVVRLAESLNHYEAFTAIEWAGKSFSIIVNGISLIAERRNFDLETAVMEKVEYNKRRADHKPENRASAGGKKF